MNGGSRYLRIAAPTATFLAFLAAWQAFVVLRQVPTLLLPAPSVIGAQVVADLPYLLRLSAATARDSLLGTVIAVLVAVVGAWVVHTSDAVSRLLSSASVALKALPVVALFPIATVFLGNTSAAVVAIVAISALPVMFVYTLQGLRQASTLDDLMHVIAAGPWRSTWSLRLPQSLPYVVTGLRTVLPLAVITAIIAEYFGGPITTLGTYIRRESANLHTVTMWSAIVLACVLGLLAAGVGTAGDAVARRWVPTSTGAPRSG